MVDGGWIPIIWAFATVGIVGIVFWAKTQRARIEAEAGGSYQKLAEEALRSQKILLEEVRRMNESLREIERVLKEV